ncbi:Tn3 family transposase, partial [Nostoc sp.]|uniref:Tn3 family transposase n=1 Tax=Nostoc sp. TaxID=1180 RepID=UPI003FA589B1
EAGKLARPADFDYFNLLDRRYSQLRRYTPTLLSAFEFKASNPAAAIVEALNLIKELNYTNRRNIPDDAPVDFVKPRWLKYVFNNGKIDRHYYEMCVLSELRDCLRSGDISVGGLNLAVAAIVLWNTVYLENAVNLLKSEGVIIPEEYLQHLSPMGWEHINLTGDYIWNLKSASSIDNLRPLRRKKINFKLS